MLKTIQIKQKELSKNFQMLESWEDKYEYILDFSEKIPIIEEQYKTDENLVKACQSKMWLWRKN